MFGISGFELLLIAAFVLIIFGPDKLPELARMAGKAMSTFKRAQEDMERVIKGEMDAVSTDPMSSNKPESPAAKPSVTPATATAAQIWAPDEDDAEEEEEE